MSEDKMTFWELIIGILLFSVLFGVAGAILAENGLAFFLGVVFGGAVAAFLCFHMYKTLEVTLDLEAERAQRRAHAMTGIRTLIMGLAVLAAIWFSEQMSIVGTVLGILTLKLAAFLQPVLHKGITGKIFNKGR